MRSTIALILTTVLLAACATPAEQAAQMEREVDRMIVVYGPACDKLGYQNKTDLWRDCVLRLSMKDEIELNRPDPMYFPVWRRHY